MTTPHGAFKNESNIVAFLLDLSFTGTSHSLMLSSAL